MTTCPSPQRSQLYPTQINNLKKRRNQIYDRRAAIHATPQQIDALQKNLASPPIIPYNVDPSSHGHLINQWALQQVTEVFPKQRGPKRPNYMSNESIKLIKLAGEAHGKWRALHDDLVNAKLAATFHALKINAHQCATCQLWFDKNSNKLCKGYSHKKCIRGRCYTEHTWHKYRGFITKNIQLDISRYHQINTHYREAIQKQIQYDIAQSIHEYKQRMHSALNSGDPQRMHQVVRRLKTDPWENTQTTVYDENGNLQTHIPSVRLAWKNIPPNSWMANSSAWKN